MSANNFLISLNNNDDQAYPKAKQWTTGRYLRPVQGATDKFYLELKGGRKDFQNANSVEISKSKIAQQAGIAQFMEKTRKKNKTRADKDESVRQYYIRHPEKFVDSDAKFVRPDLLSFEVDMSWNNRMKKYNKFHKCGCLESKIRLGYNILIKGKEQFQVRCHHKSSKNFGRKCFQCKNCGTSGAISFVSPCNCHYFVCIRCGISNFVYSKSDGSTYNQFHDQHCDNLIVTVKEETVKALDNEITLVGENVVQEPSQVSGTPEFFKKFLKEHTRKVIPKTSRAMFFHEMRGNKATYAKAVTLNEKKASEPDFSIRFIPPSKEEEKPTDENSVDEVPSEKSIPKPVLSDFSVKRVSKIGKKKFSKPSIVESHPQGGVMSSVASGAKNLTNSSVQALKAAFSDLKDKISEYKRSLSHMRRGCNIVQGLIDFFDIIEFLIKRILDYASIRFFNDLLHLIHAVTSSTLKIPAILLALTGFVNGLIEAEELSYYRLRKYTAHDIAYPHRKVDCGVFHRTAQKYIKRTYTIKDRYKYLTYGDLANITNKTLSSWFKVLPDSIGQSSGIMSTVIDFLRKFIPSKFSGGIKHLSYFLKDFLPLLQFCNGSASIMKHVHAFVSRIFGEQNADEYFSENLKKEKHPLHNLHVAVLAFVMAKNNAVGSLNETDCRRKLVDMKALATAHMLENNKISNKFMHYCRTVDQMLNSVPEPREREFEPFVMGIVSLPGGTKSSVWPALIAPLIDMNAAEAKKTTYTWNNTSEYHAGIVGKRVILFDDYAQDPETTEPANLVRLSTTAPFPIDSPNITGFEIKGMTISPEVLVILSNDFELGRTKVFSPGAVDRRFDVVYEMIAKLNFAEKDIATQKIFKIHKCYKYPELVKKEFNIIEAVELNRMLNHHKKQIFKTARSALDDIITEVDSIDFDELAKNHAGAVDFSAMTGNFKTDYEQYIGSKQLQVVEEPDKENKAPFIKTKTAKLKEYGSRIAELFKRKREAKAKGVDKSIIFTDQEMADVFGPRPPIVAQDILRGIAEQGGEDQLIPPDDEVVDLLPSFGDDEIQRVINNRDASKEKEPKIVDSSDESGLGSHDITSLISMALSAGETALSLSFPPIIIAIMSYNYRTFSSILENPLTNKRVKVVRVIAGFTSACAAVMCAYCLFSGKNDNEQSGTTRTAKRAPALIRSHVQQGNFDDSLLKVKKATGTIVKDDGAGNACLFVGGHYILTVSHFFRSYSTSDGLLREGQTIHIRKAGWNMTKTFEFERKRLIRFPNKNKVVNGPSDVRSDVVLYLLPLSGFMAATNIVKNFWSGDYGITDTKVCRVDLPTKFIGGELEFDDFDVHHGTVQHDMIFTRRILGKEEYYHQAASADYIARDASCGTAVIRKDTSDVDNILGIHIAVQATGEQHSLFHFVTREELEKAMTATVYLEQSGHIDADLSPLFEDEFPEKNTLTFVGVCDKKHRIYQNKKSDLQPSLTYEAHGPHKTEPSILHKDDPRLPEEHKAGFYRTLNKKFGTIVHFKPSELFEAKESLIQELRAMVAKSSIKPRLLFQDEVLNGVPHWNGSSSIPMNTSCGWPYNCESITKNKLIMNTNNVLEMGSRLRSDYQAACLNLEKGIVPFLPFALTVKDERLPLRKIYNEPKSRLFANGNIVHYLISRRYFHATMLVYYNAGQTYAATSLDRISVEWHDMISYLREAGDEGFDGDTKNWDTSMCKELRSAAFEILISPVVDQIGLVERVALHELMTDPTYICGSSAYKANGTLASGALLTFLENCVINEILHRSAYLHIMRNNTLNSDTALFATIRAYKKYTRGKRGGDDTVQVCAPDILQYFNADSYGEYLRKHGITYTSVDKSDNLVKQRDVNDLSFLKCTTRYDEGYYLPLAEKESLEEMCNWIRLNKNNKDALKATSDNCNAALRSMFFYGPIEFVAFRRKLLDKEPRLELLTYNELAAIWAKYRYFPGSHSDYTTVKDQMDEYDSRAPVKTPEYPAHIHRDNMENTINEITEIIETLVIDSNEQVGPINSNLKNHAATMNSVGLTETITPNIENDYPDSSIATAEDSSEGLGTSVQSKEPTVVYNIKSVGQEVGATDTRAEGHMNDTSWTLEKFESKYTQLGQYSWDGSMIQGTIIKQWSLPNDILVTQAMRTPFEVTGYWRAQNIKLKFTFSTSGFYAGSFLVGFLPTLGRATLESTEVLRMRQIGAAQISVADAQSYEMKIPFRHYLDWLEYPHDTLGSVKIVVLNPLRTGDGNTANVVISASVCIEGSEFKVPEFVPPPTGQSFKFLKSTPQSGSMSTAIESKPVVNRNLPNAQIPSTMMCAGLGVISNPPIKQFVDHPISLTELMKRHRVIKQETVVLPPSTTTMTTVIRTILPRLEVFNLRFASMFATWRGGLSFKIDARVIGPVGPTIGDFVGKVWVAYGDIDDSTDYPFVPLEISNKLNSAHHRFDAAHPAEFTIPYAAPTFTCPINTSTSAYTYPLEVYVEYTNLSQTEVTLYVETLMAVQDDFTMGIFQGFPTLRDATVQKKRKWGANKENFVFINSRDQGGVFDWIDTAISNCLPIVEKLDTLGNLLDAHPVCYQPEPLKTRRMGYTVATNQIQYVERLYQTDHNGLALADEECYGLAKPETGMYDMMRGVKTYLYAGIPWEQGQAEGTILWSTKVGPLANSNSLNNNPATPYDYFANFFNCWQGSLIYYIDVVASQQHSGRLILTYHPNLENPPANLVEATQQYFSSFELTKGKCEGSYQVPFLCKTPYRPVATRGYSGVNAPQSLSPFNGCIALRVQNPLRSTTAVASTVDINISTWAGDDFALESYGSISNTINL